MRPIHAPTASHASQARPMETARAEESTPYYSRGRLDFVICRRWLIGLYLLSLLGILLLGVPALIALALAYVRRAHMEEPVLRSHFDGLIGGVWSYLGIALLALVLLYVGNGLVLRLAAGVGIAALVVLCWTATKGLVRILEWRSYDGAEEIPD
jgi:uncharacterized membrane protein